MARGSAPLTQCSARYFAVAALEIKLDGRVVAQVHGKRMWVAELRCRVSMRVTGLIRVRGIVCDCGCGCER